MLLDLVKDPKKNVINMKEKKKIQTDKLNAVKLAKEKKSMQFEDVTPPKENVTFLEMNLSSKLLKVSGQF